MLPDRVSNPGPLTYESGALPIALRGPARMCFVCLLVLSLLFMTKRNNCCDFMFAYKNGKALSAK